MTTKPRLHRATALLLLGLLLAGFCAGCASMADPYATDMPWSPTNEWEFAPNIPRSMLNNN